MSPHRSFSSDDDRDRSSPVIIDMGDRTREPGEPIFTAFVYRPLTLREKIIRALRWLAGIAVAAGVFLILFPIILVLVVGVFSFAAAVLIAVWWQLRRQRGRALMDEWRDRINHFLRRKT